MTALTLSESELVDVTGYVRPAEQLRELHLQGFHRARRSPRTGRIILERQHFDAVSHGQAQLQEPAVKVPVLRMVRA